MDFGCLALVENFVADTQTISQPQHGIFVGQHGITAICPSVLHLARAWKREIFGDCMEEEALFTARFCPPFGLTISYSGHGYTAGCQTRRCLR